MYVLLSTLAAVTYLIILGIVLFYPIRYQFSSGEVGSSVPAIKKVSYKNKIINSIMDTNVGYKLFSGRDLIYTVPLGSVLYDKGIVYVNNRNVIKVIFKILPGGVSSDNFLFEEDTLLKLMNTDIRVEN